MAIQLPRGMKDLLGDELDRHNLVSNVARKIANLFGFSEIRTPIMEFTPVFARTLGGSSDVVNKEMYSFDDRGGENITLRPENTASIARAFIANGLAQSVPVKWFYTGPMFRYERPQKGRLRQFHQIGIEFLGEADAFADAEIIACGARILHELGLQDTTNLELNTLGDAQSRDAYRSALIAYFTPHAKALSEDSQRRLQENPLRILDSKAEEDFALVQEAPSYEEYLNKDSKDFFARLCDYLDQQSIAYTRNVKLVRGLDYYCHTAFEFTTRDLGAQATVMAGGRYDGLIPSLGGDACPGVGWAAGIERLAMLCTAPRQRPRPVVLVAIGDKADAHVLILAQRLRAHNIACEFHIAGNTKKRMRFAAKRDAAFVVIFGNDELAQNHYTIKNMDDGTQMHVASDNLMRWLENEGMKR
ncbi:MAG: histidine--tRNA ligase [Pseudomonadota bacterium]